MSLHLLKKSIKFKKELLETRNTRTEILKHFSKNLQTSLLYVGFPTFLTTMAANVFNSNDVFNIESITSGVFVAGVASLLTSGKKISSIWNGNKSNYYLDIRKDLDSKDNSTISITNMSRFINEYVND